MLTRSLRLARPLVAQPRAAASAVRSFAANVPPLPPRPDAQNPEINNPDHNPSPYGGTGPYGSSDADPHLNPKAAGPRGMDPSPEIPKAFPQPGGNPTLNPSPGTVNAARANPPPPPPGTKEAIQKRNTWLALALVTAGIGCYWAFFKEVAVETAQVEQILKEQNAAIGRRAGTAVDRPVQPGASAAVRQTDVDRPVQPSATARKIDEVIRAEREATQSSATSLE